MQHSPGDRSDLPFAQHPSNMSIEFGGWQSTYSFANRQGYCSGLYIPKEWSDRHSFHQAGHDILHTLHSDIRARFLCILPTAVFQHGALWHTISAMYLQCTLFDAPPRNTQTQLRCLLLQNEAGNVCKVCKDQLVVCRPRACTLPIGPCTPGTDPEGYGLPHATCMIHLPPPPL